MVPKTDAEIVEIVTAWVEESSEKPEPADWVKERLLMMAAVATDTTLKARVAQTFETLVMANVAVIRAAYELGRSHGGLTLVVAPDDRQQAEEEQE